MKSMLNRRRGLPGAALAAALLAVIGVLTVTGAREPASALKLFSGDVWLADQATGAVTQVLGFAGRAGAQAKVASPGDPFTVVQRSDGAYILNARTGRLTRVANDRQGVAASQREPGDPSALQVVAAAGPATWVVDDTSGIVQQVDPATLVPRGPQIALGGPVGPATSDGAGSLWLPLASRGLVEEVPVDGGTPRSHVVGQPGDSLALVSTSDGIWAVDPQAGKLVALSDPARPPAAIPQFSSGQPAPVTASSPSSPDIVVVDGSQVIDVNTATAMVSSVSGSGYPSVTAAVINGNRVYLLDGAGHQLDVLNMDPLSMVGPVPVPPGSNQLVTHDELVFVNNSQSPAAVVVAPNGAVTDLSKYLPPKPGVPGPSDPASVEPQAPTPAPSFGAPGPGPAAAPVLPAGPSLPLGPLAPVGPSAYSPPSTTAQPQAPTASTTSTTQAPAPPGTPSLVSVAGGAGTLSVRWTPGSGAATGYVLTITPAGGGPAVSQPAAAAGATQASISGLTRGASYCVQIQATGAQGGSPLSIINAAVDCATTSPNAPAAPTALSFEPGKDSAWVTFGAAQGSQVGGLTYTIALNGTTVKSNAVPGQTYPITLGASSGGVVTVRATNGGGLGPPVAADVWGYLPGPTGDCINGTRGFFENGLNGPLGGCANNGYSVQVNPYDNIYTGLPPSVPMNADDELVCYYYEAPPVPIYTGGRYLTGGPGQSTCPAAPSGYLPGAVHEVVWAKSGSTHTAAVQVVQGTMANTGVVEDVEVGPGQTANQVAATTLLRPQVLYTFYDDPA